MPNRPSCGKRFSAMLRPAMIFSRAIILACKCLGGGEDRIEHSVDTIPHHQPPFERFKMDVARPLPNRLKQHRVDQPNDRGLVGRIQQVLRLIELMSELIETLIGRDIFHHLLRAGRVGDFVIGTV